MGGKAGQRGYWAGVLLALAACTEPVKKPTPPDLGELDRAYRVPDGALDADSIAAVLSALDERVAGLAPLCGFTSSRALFCASGTEGCEGCAGLTPVLAALANLGGGDDAGMAANDDLSRAIEGDGYVRITRICPGHLDSPSPDPANGTMQLTFGFTEGGLDPVPFGGFFACKLDVRGAENTLSGELALSFGQRVQLGTLTEQAPVLRVQGQAVTALGTRALAGDIQITLGGDLGFALRLEPAGLGRFVFVQSAAGGGFRAQNGSFVCDQEACVNERGERVELP